MRHTISLALIVSAAVILFSLVYTRIPGLPAPASSTSTPKSTTSLETATSTSPSPQPVARGNGTIPTVEIGGRTIRVTVADTPQERELGLSGRPGLAEDEGMLFVFDADGRHSFWMKDMLFSIDIVWVSKEGVVVDFVERATPETYPRWTFVPNVAARYVLELPAGFVEKYTVETGDIVRL